MVVVVADLQVGSFAFVFSSGALRAPNLRVGLYSLCFSHSNSRSCADGPVSASKAMLGGLRIRFLKAWVHLFLVRGSRSSSRNRGNRCTFSYSAFSNGDSAMWDGLGSAHDNNLGRETHSTIGDVFTKRFKRVTLHFSHLVVWEPSDLFPKFFRHLNAQRPKVFQ